MYLRCAIHGSPTHWKKWLPLAELWYNSSYHTALGCSPFQALYAHEPNLLLAPAVNPSSVLPAVAELVQDRDLHLQALKQHLLTAQQRMKTQADKKRLDRQFEVGEQVLLKLQPYAQTSVANRPYPKLAYKFYGPYEILEKIGTVAYRLKLPPASLIHPVFHVSQLKPFHADFTPVFSELPQVSDFTVAASTPEKILERRLVKKGNVAVPQVKIKWAHLPASSATWEDYNVVRARFPDSAAWGQAGSSARGDVTTVNGAAKA